MSAKYRQVADNLTLRIRRGEIENGDKLPGEVDLAQTYDVSRTTIRQALATLQQAGLIETWTGSGSYVRYDGAILDDTSGWTKALAGLGVETQARVLRLERMVDAALAKELGLSNASFLAVDRVRSIVGGEAISIERSRLPWRKSFAAVVRDGLIGGSLQRTIESFAIRPRGGWETVGLMHLSVADASLLARAEGDAFLATRRIVHDTSGDLIECVDSLLHPGHFKLQFKFGEGAK